MRRFVRSSSIAAALLLAASVFAPAGVWAEEETPGQAERIQVGQEAPAFTLPTIDGDPRSLESLKGDKPLVLIFFRGAW